MKFTKEEISLCKQVAEKYRKRIDDGDWYLRHDYDEPDVYLEGMDDDKAVAKSLPLWTIPDCLEFLEGKGFDHIHSFIHFDNGYWTFTAENIITSNNFKKARGEKAYTKLEACLKAVLAVLEEDK